MSRVPVRLAVMVFPGTQTLPLYAAQAQGLFAKRGLAVDLYPAPNSAEQRQGLAAGRYQIVHGAADQAVALVEDGGADAVIVAGGDNGFNHLFVQPDVRTLAGLRGKTLAADVANTGWSFVLYRMLRLNGLERTDYTVAEAGAPFRRFAAMRDDGLAAAILNPPFAIHARNAGFRDIGAVVDTVGPYLGTCLTCCAAGPGECRDAHRLPAGRRSRSLRWALSPANRAAAEALYAERLNVTPEIAAEMYRLAADQGAMISRDAAFDHAGFETVLALRSEAEGSTCARPTATSTFRIIGRRSPAYDGATRRHCGLSRRKLARIPPLPQSAMADQEDDNSIGIRRSFVASTR